MLYVLIMVIFYSHEAFRVLSVKGGVFRESRTKSCTVGQNHVHHKKQCVSRPGITNPGFKVLQDNKLSHCNLPSFSVAVSDSVAVQWLSVPKETVL